jgi:hypothetical protein
LVCSTVNSSKTLKEIVSSSNSGEAVIATAKKVKKAAIKESAENRKPEFKTVKKYQPSESEIDKQAKEIHDFIKDFEKPIINKKMMIKKIKRIKKTKK